MPSIIDEGWVKVPIYSLVTPEGMELSPLLCSYYVQFPGYEGTSTGEIYLEGADGTKYYLIRVEDPNSEESSEYRLWFRDVPAGEYTLHLPRILYVGDDVSSIALELPREDGQTIPCGRTLTFISGATFHIRSINFAKEQSETVFTFLDWRKEEASSNQVSDMQDDFIYTLDYEMEGGSPYLLVGLIMDSIFYHQFGDALVDIHTDPFVLHGSSNDAFGTIGFHAYSQLHLPAPELVYLTARNPVYMDDQAYSFPVTVR